MKITYLGKALKDLKVLANYVGIGKSADYTVLNFKNTIINNTNYDKDFYKEWLSTISSNKKRSTQIKKGEEKRNVGRCEEKRNNATRTWKTKGWGQMHEKWMSLSWGFQKS